MGPTFQSGLTKAEKKKQEITEKIISAGNINVLETRSVGKKTVSQIFLRFLLKKVFNK